MRWIALALVAVIYFAIVAAHQLTPYMALLGVAALVVLGLVWRGWLVLALFAVIAVGFLAPRYGLISSQFGGVFSGGDVFENAAGSQGILHKAAELRTGRGRARARRLACGWARPPPSRCGGGRSAGWRSRPSSRSARSWSWACRATAGRRSTASSCSRRRGARC